MFAEKLFNEIAEKKDSGITFEVGIRIYLELTATELDEQDALKIPEFVRKIHLYTRLFIVHARHMST